MQADDPMLAPGHGNSADAGPTAGVAGVAAVPTVQVPIALIAKAQTIELNIRETGTFNSAGTFYYLPIPYNDSGSANLADLEAFSVARSGAFSALSASPFTIGTAPIYAAIDNQNNVLYVTNSGSDNISALTISGTGTLSVISGEPFNTGSNPVNIGLQFAGSGASNNNARQATAMHKLAQMAPQ